MRALDSSQRALHATQHGPDRQGDARADRGADSAKQASCQGRSDDHQNSSSDENEVSDFNDDFVHFSLSVSSGLSGNGFGWAVKLAVYLGVSVQVDQPVSGRHGEQRG